MPEAKTKKAPDKQFKENVDEMVKGKSQKQMEKELAQNVEKAKQEKAGIEKLEGEITTLKEQLAEEKEKHVKKMRTNNVQMPDVEAPVINRNALILHYAKAKEKRLANPKAKNKCFIVGYAETTRDYTPFNDMDAEVWGLNELYQMIPRADRWFEIHAPGGNLHNSRRNPKHREWLRKCTIPVYMPVKMPDIPMSVAYPKDEIIALFGDYFTNSISWMIVLALYEGFPEVHVYGVDMALNKEYREQKPSCEWFMGMAAILCDKFVIPFESDMLKAHYLYGFQNSQPLERKFRDKIEELKRKKMNALNTLEDIKAGINKLDGAIEVTGYFLHNHINPEG